MKLDIKQAVTQPITTLINNGKNRVFPEQKSNTTSESLIDTLNNFTGMQFNDIADFLGYYQKTYFDTAYTKLTPFSCHQLAISNPYITSAINAIADPISSADLIAVPSTPETVPVEWELDYLEYLVNHPNPYQPEDIFLKQLVQDKLQTGSAYIEVNYNDAGFPARLDRIPPYKITCKVVGGDTVFIRNDNGYIYPVNGLIPIFNPNPYNQSKGLSPLVPLFINILTDEALMEHNLRYFVKDTLKGIISVSDSVDDTVYRNELDRIRQQIRDMEATGESGHLIMHGATFQALGNSNRDMMTPEILEANINAVCAVYHVPPHKVMRVESGSLGTGTGESQEDAMNETINNEASTILSYLNFYLLQFAGIKSSKLVFKDLTKTDETRQAELETMRLNNGTLTLNEVRGRYGDELYEDMLADEPLLPNNRVPLSMIGATPEPLPVPESEPVPEEEEEEEATELDNKKQTQMQHKINQYLQAKGLIRDV